MCIIQSGLLLIKNKTNNSKYVIWQLNSMQLQKKWNLIQNSPAVKKVCGPQKYCCKKRCEIQSGGQEMAVMVG